jgi:hypothetical protein
MKYRLENQEELVMKRIQFWHEMAINGPTVRDRARGRHNLYQLVKKYPQYGKKLGITVPSLTKMVFTKPAKKGAKRGKR